MKLHVVKKFFGAALLSVVATSGLAQDLIARQAPSDKRMNDVRNVKLNNLMSTENLQNPAADIYYDWDNRGVSSVAGHVDANYKVDLRGFCMPTTSRKITSKYGARWGRRHEGLDIKVYIGDTIRAAFNGKVRVVRYDRGGYGYYVVIRHPNGLETLYGHLSKQIVKEDQIVKAGEPIGLGGNTGRSTGSHLHFETRLVGKPINPATMFDFENQDVTGDFYVVGAGSISKGERKNVATAQLNAEQIEKETEIASNGATEVSNSGDATVQTATNNDNNVQAATQSTTKSKQRTKKSVTYRVKNGDNLYTIARRHGITVAKLCKLNGIKANSYIYKGQVLKCS